MNGGYWRWPRFWRIQCEFKLADFWVGVFYRRDSDGRSVSCGHDIWICLLPCLPIHVTYWHEGLEGRRIRLAKKSKTLNVKAWALNE